MANNQYVNKVVYDNNTLIDITDTTATAEDVANGKTFYAADGSRTLGTFNMQVDQTFDPTSSNAISGVGVNSAVGTGLSVSNGKINHSNSVTAKTTQAVYPIKIDAQGHISASGSAVTIPAAVAVKGNAETDYRTGNVNLTAANIGAAASSHTHGKITNAGAISTNATIASSDRLLISDADDSNLIKRTSITFGTSTTTFLSNKGTWLTPAGAFSGIDTANVLSTATTYTATQDCWCCFYGDPQNANYSLTIAGVEVGLVGSSISSGRVRGEFVIPVKSGQKVVADGGSVKFYGLK